MNNTDRFLIFGLLAIIAWELYAPPAAASSCNQGSSAANLGPNTASPWMQQLSQATYGDDLFTPQCGVFGACR